MKGADKGLVLFNQQPMASYAIAALNHCAEVIINANRHQEVYKKCFRMTVISDNRHPKAKKPQFEGPLAGMLSALRYAQKKGYHWVITVPCDAPYITADYVTNMWRAQQQSQDKIFIAHDGFKQPVFSLLHTSITSELEGFLSHSETKKILAFYQSIGYRSVQFSNTKAFTNINYLEEKKHHEKNTQSLSS